VDTVLGPEMRSTGEVMGLDSAFGTAFAKSQAAAYGSLPVGGRAFVSIANRDKRAAILPVMRLADLGFQLLATEGTALALRRHGVPVEVVPRYRHGTPDRPDCVQRILDGEVALVFNTPWGAAGNSGPRLDGYEIRTAAVAVGIPCVTTVQGMTACVQGVEALIRGDIGVRSLQELHEQLRKADR
jgi:carbamoyl-phosphate synthase large subunit